MANHGLLSTEELSSVFEQMVIEESYKSFMFYEAPTKHSLFHELGKTTRQRMFLAGNRTGKTHSACVELAMHVTGVYPNDWNGYRFSRAINAISASIRLFDTQDILYKKLILGNGREPPLIHPSFIVGKKTQSFKGDTVYVQHVTGGKSELKFRAFQQGAESFQGTNQDVVHLDECPPFDVYREVCMRLTSFDHEKTQLMITMWPQRNSQDIVDQFLGNASEGEVKNGRCYVKASWSDNPYLTDDEKKQLRATIPAWELEAREHGNVIYGQGKVFIMPESEIVVEPFEVPKHWHRVYGLDCSSTSGGTWGSVQLAIDRDTDTVYAISDYKATGITPSEHAYNLTRTIPDWCVGMVDPAGAGENMHTKEKTIDFLITRGGLRLQRAHKANGTKEAMVDEIYERVKTGKFKIFYGVDGRNLGIKGCVNLINEWRQYSRDDNSFILKKNDHCMDALFYALNGLPNARTESSSIYMAEYGNEVGYY